MLKFIGFSGIGWILDFSVFTVLGLFEDNVILNNIISSWVGVTFVFIFSTKSVFQNNSKISLKIKYLIYLFYQCILIFLVSNILAWVNGIIISNINFEIILSFSHLISKILITPITMILNFIVMKNIIEKI
ncbi:MAG: GtrA family protein [Ruminococcus sp.]|nr:GtrA family protein [Ruminococcus sp.]